MVSSSCLTKGWRIYLGICCSPAPSSTTVAVSQRFDAIVYMKQNSCRILLLVPIPTVCLRYDIQRHFSCSSFVLFVVSGIILLHFFVVLHLCCIQSRGAGMRDHKPSLDLSLACFLLGVLYCIRALYITIVTPTWPVYVNNLSVLLSPTGKDPYWY